MEGLTHYWCRKTPYHNVKSTRNKYRLCEVPEGTTFSLIKKEFQSPNTNLQVTGKHTSSGDNKDLGSRPPVALKIITRQTFPSLHNTYYQQYGLRNTKLEYSTASLVQHRERQDWTRNEQRIKFSGQIYIAFAIVVKLHVANRRADKKKNADTILIARQEIFANYSCRR